MFGNNTLPLLLLLLLSNNSCNTNNTCDRNTLAMCLCLLCLMDNDDGCNIT